MGEDTVEGTKERLFLAAVKVFARTGYKGATVREICRIAGAANINAINYYFGGKEKLYKAILDAMFTAYQTRKEKQASGEQKRKRPEERLRDYIDSYCSILFCGGEIAREMAAIFLAEMSRPSRYLDEMVQKYMTPEAEELTGIVRDILGSKTPLPVLRNCAVSIIGQITYYSFAWPMFSRAVPDHPPLEDYKTFLADHVYRFSLGGLAAVKKATAAGNLAVAPRKKGSKRSR
jgi:AcrR family transcriptional regulator